ncbi:hypothetical protein ACQP2P_25525 [Dactylosporangium sp. CA-139114]|uniref:hypothetical protein n=1 Tax=unclassified Dactylosporangium TaxID=2621675 RepID=UPI003331E89B
MPWVLWVLAGAVALRGAGWLLLAWDRRQLRRGAGVRTVAARVASGSATVRR